MFIRFFSPASRYFAWCFLASVWIASIESLGYSLAQNSGDAMPFIDFLQRLSNSCAILLIALTVTWCVLAFFMVWLGGVRPGIALFFMLSLFMSFAYLVVVLDVVFTYTSKYDPHWGLLMRYFAAFALFFSAMASMMLGKIAWRFPRICFSQRLYAIIAMLFLGLAYAVWTKDNLLPHIHDSHYWWFLVAAAILASGAYWLLTRLPRQYFLSLALLFCVMIAPSPVIHAARQHFHSSHETALPASHPVRHVILITIDTLRQDALQPYNRDAPDTPRINQFSQDSAVFTSAFSTAPWTFPSVASILTGAPPRVHHVLDSKATLPEEIPTIAEAMKDAGYRTAAIGRNSMLLPHSNFDQGFQEYHWFPQKNVWLQNYNIGLTHNLLELFGLESPDAALLTDYAIQWLTAHAQQNFFLWLHYFDPHMPYTPPQSFLPSDPALREQGAFFEEVRGGRMGSMGRTPEGRAWIRALYDGEVRFLDTELGRLWKAMKSISIYDDALIVFTSDHGEEFWDHDRFEHGHTLYNELIRVPLLLKRPGKHEHTTIETPVSTQSIMPTVLDLCGVQTDAQALLLPPLSPLLQNDPDAYQAQPIYTGATLFFDHIEAVIFDGMKYIRGSMTGQEQLFNLNNDPHERNAVTALDPLNLEKGRKLLDGAITEDARISERLGVSREKKDIIRDQDAMRALQALGYL